MNKLAVVLLVGALCGLGLAGCPGDDCADAPVCRNGKAVNCVSSCSVGPCSTGATIRDCGEQQCEVIAGDPQSIRFSIARAVCVNDPNACDPSTSGPPVCDLKGSVTGCSPYKRIITASCAQAAVFFADAPCCTTGVNADAGTVDAGVPDAGSSLDGGQDGGP